MAKRKSCLGIVAIGFVVLVVVGVVGVFCADVYFSAQYSAQQQKFLEAGVPMTAEDLGIVSVATEENAATLYRGAVEAIEAAAEDGEGFDSEAYRERFLALYSNPCGEEPDTGRRGRREELLPLTVAELGAVDDWFGSLGAKYKELEGVWEREESNWGIFSGVSGEEGGVAYKPERSLDSLSEARELARQLVFKAMWEHSRGETGAALESIALCMRVANDFAEEPLLISGMVRIAIGQLALSALGDIVSQSDGGVEIPLHLQQELDRLRDRAMVVRVLDGERWYSEEMGREMGLGTNIFSRALFHTPNRIRLNEVLFTTREAVGEADYGRRQQLLRPLEEIVEGATGGPMWPFNALASMMAPNLLRSMLQFDEFFAKGDLMAQGIALKRYKALHGAYPETLEAIGDLLGGGPLPQDPFTGKPFRYAREGDGFRLWSAGQGVEQRIGWCVEE